MSETTHKKSSWLTKKAGPAIPSRPTKYPLCPIEFSTQDQEVS